MNTFYYILLLHFIGDFVMQSRKIAENKASNFYYMTEHCIIMMAVFAIGLYSAIPSSDTWCKFLALLWCTHFLQDTFVWRSYKWIMTKQLGKKIATFKYWKDHGFWITIGFDQMLHIATLYFLWRVFI